MFLTCSLSASVLFTFPRALRNSRQSGAPLSLSPPLAPGSLGTGHVYTKYCLCAPVQCRMSRVCWSSSTLPPALVQLETAKDGWRAERRRRVVRCQLGPVIRDAWWMVGQCTGSVSVDVSWSGRHGVIGTVSCVIRMIYH